MIPLTITPNLDTAPWTDIAQDTPTLGLIARVGRLPNGTTSGKSTVTVLIVMPDGSQHLAQTTIDLFLCAARALATVDNQPFPPPDEPQKN